MIDKNMKNHEVRDDLGGKGEVEFDVFFTFCCHQKRMFGDVWDFLIGMVMSVIVLLLVQMTWQRQHQSLLDTSISNNDIMTDDDLSRVTNNITLEEAIQIVRSWKPIHQQRMTFLSLMARIRDQTNNVFHTELADTVTLDDVGSQLKNRFLDFLCADPTKALALLTDHPFLLFSLSRADYVWFRDWCDTHYILFPPHVMDLITSLDRQYCIPLSNSYSILL